MNGPEHITAEAGAGAASDRPIRAIALMSGGLDSLLAAAVTVRQGIEVIGLHVAIGFAPVAFTDEVVSLGAGYRIPVRHRDAAAAFIREVLLNPRHGYGQGMNPCIDCHLFMLRLARELMDEEVGRFVITGEVLGQRPMSQHQQALELLARESGLADLLLRPLSAAFLPPTRPEREGWIDRVALPRIRGRSRKVQLRLASEYGIAEYPQPAGGCLLPDPAYARRLKNVIDHLPDPAVLTPADARRLRYGRFLRLPSGAAVQIGRHEADNTALAGLAAGYWRVEAVDHRGPLTLVDAAASEEDLMRAAVLTARYGQGRGEPRVRVRLDSPGGESREVEVTPSEPGAAEGWLIP